MDARETGELKMWYKTQIEIGKAAKENKAPTKEKHRNETKTSIGKEQKELVEKERDLRTKNQSVKTPLRNIASDIKDISKELEQMTQLQEGVGNVSLQSLPRESIEETLAETTELQKDDGVC